MRQLRATRRRRSYRLRAAAALESAKRRLRAGSHLDDGKPPVGYCEKRGETAETPRAGARREGNLLRHVTSRLATGGIEAAQAEAARIVAAAGGEEAPDASERAEQLLARRLSGVPLAYVVGHEPFLGIDIFTNPAALIPRRETELLGRTAIETLREMSRAAGQRVIDMCCGAGNLACAIASLVDGARVWAADLTDGCVLLTARNVAHHGLGNRVEVVRSDLFAGLAGCGLEGSVDVVVCNPPYISSGRLEKDRRSLLEHEPREAFDGGPYGLSIQQRVIKEALDFLRPGGVLVMEIGRGQERRIGRLFERAKAYEEPRLSVDENGDVRVAAGRRRQG